MALGLFRKNVNELFSQPELIKVSSCGLQAVRDQPVSKNAVVAMEDYGIDISGHKALPPEKKQISEADLLLTMTQSQADKLKAMFPAKKDQTFTLGEYAGDNNMDIKDPFGADLKTYKKCAADMNHLLQAAARRIIDAVHAQKSK